MWYKAKQVRDIDKDIKKNNKKKKETTDMNRRFFNRNSHKHIIMRVNLYGNYSKSVNIFGDIFA